MAKEDPKYPSIPAQPESPKPPEEAPDAKALAAEEIRKAHIVKPAKVKVDPDAPKIDASLAGTYRVTHGTVQFGHGVRAEKGAHVQLNAADAHRMLAAGIVKSLNEEDDESP